MSRARTYVAIVGSALLLAGVSFSASSQDNPDSSASSSAPASLTDAVQSIESATGGKVLEVRVRRHGPGFAAVVTKGNQLANIKVHPVNGQVTKMSVDEVPQWMHDWKLRADAQDIHKARVSVSDAIRTAEQAQQAPAVDAGLAKPLSPSNDVLAYNIEVLKDGEPRRVAVDAKTGELIANPDEVLTPWTPERLAEKDEQHPSRQ